MFITRPNPANIKQKYVTTWEKIIPVYKERKCNTKKSLYLYRKLEKNA